jgi:cation-transporting ATPase E
VTAEDVSPGVPPDVDLLDGLLPSEVEQRRREGLVNEVPTPTSRSYGDIVRANVFTRFNAILGVLLVAVLAVGEYRDGLFGIVLVANALIGIVQEVRAKQTLDRLSLLNAPTVRVRRGGTTQVVAAGDVVLDDVIELSTGDQVVVDAEVLAADGLEIDESLLSGEAEPVAKDIDDEALSGSFVVAGTGFVQATSVGADSYAYRLRSEASRFGLVRSELRDGVNRLLQIVQWLMIPTAVLLAVSQFTNHESFDEAIQGIVAGVVAMIPEGLVLLTSLAMALGVIRLGRRHVLTQELAAIEGLARVDVICLDKTGTLTEGRLELERLEVLGDARSQDVAAVVGALVAAEPNPNPSLAAVARVHGTDPGWAVVARTPFSSARKWAGATFADRGTWLLGAPDILLERAADAARAETSAAVELHAAVGRRVILLASADTPVGDQLPPVLEPVALLVLEEQLRADAPDTIGYFLAQGVTVKVISGDSPTTVGAVAARVGVPLADQPVDARALPDAEADPEEFADVVDRHGVFGRVTPQQKRAMVHALQRRGHTVAMTGDGVNDTLALKDADIGVAMGAGSAAARSVARFVLLDNSFAVFPSVVAEGRRLIANVERVANLFVTKTIYAMLLSLAVGVAGRPFPFYPRHLTIISSLTIGIPAFFLALAPNAQRARPGFLGRVLRFAIPAGVVAASATFAGYTLAGHEDVSLAEQRTTATLVLFGVALWVLSILARPLSGWRAGLVAGMAAAFVVVLAVPALRDYFALDLPDLTLTFAAVGIAAVACSVLELGWRAANAVGRVRRPSEQVGTFLPFPSDPESAQ